MATKRPARASPELREAPLSPRYHPELHHQMGHCSVFKASGEDRFVWPSPADGKVSVTPAQLSMLLEGIDWRMPKRTWRPLTAGNISENPAS
jgi:transposase